MMTKVRSVHNCSGHANPLTLPADVSPSLKNTLNCIRAEIDGWKGYSHCQTVRLSVRSLYVINRSSTNHPTPIIPLHWLTYKFWHFFAISSKRQPELLMFWTLIDFPPNLNRWFLVQPNMSLLSSEGKCIPIARTGTEGQSYGSPDKGIWNLFVKIGFFFFVQKFITVHAFTLKRN